MIMMRMIRNIHTYNLDRSFFLPTLYLDITKSNHFPTREALLFLFQGFFPK